MGAPEALGSTTSSEYGPDHARVSCAVGPLSATPVLRTCAMYAAMEDWLTALDRWAAAYPDNAATLKAASDHYFDVLDQRGEDGAAALEGMDPALCG